MCSVVPICGGEPDLDAGAQKHPVCSKMRTAECRKAGGREFCRNSGAEPDKSAGRSSMEENYNIEYALERILEKKENEMESIQPEKKAGYDLQEELILDDWIAEQEMKGQVVKDRQSVWGFLNQRLQKRRKKRESQWDEIMADDSEE